MFSGASWRFSGCFWGCDYDTQERILPRAVFKNKREYALPCRDGLVINILLACTELPQLFDLFEISNVAFSDKIDGNSFLTTST